MPDEGPEHLAGWTIQTQHIYTHRVIADLKEQFDMRFDANEQFFRQRISDMETASIHNINRAEIFTSRQAIQIEIPVTRIARNTAEAPCPVASRHSRTA